MATSLCQEILRQPFREAGRYRAGPSYFPAVLPAWGHLDLWLLFLSFLRSLSWRGFLALPFMTNLGVTKPTWLTPASLRTLLTSGQHSMSGAGAGGVLRTRELGNPLSPHTSAASLPGRKHTGEKPFECPKCGKCYFRKENLLEHEARNCMNRSEQVLGNWSKYLWAAAQWPVSSCHLGRILRNPTGL